MNIVLDSSVEEKAPDHIEANEVQKSKEETVSYLRSKGRQQCPGFAWESQLMCM